MGNGKRGGKGKAGEGENHLTHPLSQNSWLRHWPRQMVVVEFVRKAGASTMRVVCLSVCPCGVVCLTASHTAAEQHVVVVVDIINSGQSGELRRFQFREITQKQSKQIAARHWTRRQAGAAGRSVAALDRLTGHWPQPTRTTLTNGTVHGGRTT